MHDLTGRRFGKLVAVEYFAGKAGQKARWRCRCDCGGEVAADSFRLKNGNKKSCGCLQLEGRLARSRERSDEITERQQLAQRMPDRAEDSDGLCAMKGCDAPVAHVGFCPHHYDMWSRYGHPLAGTLFKNRRSTMRPRYKESRTYHAMKRRCLNSKCADFERYGGRGITICARWLHSFENFIADMGECPPGGTIERKDFNGNYEPSNCHWATPTAQNRNTRATRLNAGFVALAKRRYADGVSVAQIARDGGFPYFTVYQALTGISWIDVEASGNA